MFQYRAVVWCLAGCRLICSYLSAQALKQRNTQGGWDRGPRPSRGPSDVSEDGEGFCRPYGARCGGVWCIIHRVYDVALEKWTGMLAAVSVFLNFRHVFRARSRRFVRHNWSVTDIFFSNSHRILCILLRGRARWMLSNRAASQGCRTRCL